MKEKSLSKSIRQLTCPKCRQGDLFVKPGLFTFRKILTMHEECENCGQKFELEPGFWLGALWTSYPFVVLVETPFILIAISDLDISIWVIVTGMILAMLLFFPLMLRMGRSIWIHIFVRYTGGRS